MSIQSIVFLAFPNVGEQDLLAPWELFRSVAWDMNRRGEKLDVVLGSFDDGSTPTQMGTTIQPAMKLTSTDRFDMVYVPGGIGAGVQSTTETVLSFLRAHHQEGRWIGANCAGMGVLHRAGVLGRHRGDVACHVGSPSRRPGYSRRESAARVEDRP